MSKKTLKTRIINNQQFKWIIDSNEVRIYDSNKKLTRLNRNDIWPYQDYISDTSVCFWIKNNLLSHTVNS